MRNFVRLASLSLALLCLSSSCGSSDPAALTSSGYAALGKSDFGTAADDFEAALKGMPSDPNNPQYKRARMGLIEALSHVAPAQAKEDFLSLAEAGGASEGDYLTVAGRLSASKASGAMVAAIEVVDHGLKGKHSQSAALAKQMDDLKARAERGEDPEAMKKLAGLGYF